MGSRIKGMLHMMEDYNSVLNIIKNIEYSLKALPFISVSKVEDNHPWPSFTVIAAEELSSRGALHISPGGEVCGISLQMTHSGPDKGTLIFNAVNAIPQGQGKGREMIKAVLRNVPKDWKLSMKIPSPWWDIIKEENPQYTWLR